MTHTENMTPLEQANHLLNNTLSDPKNWSVAVWEAISNTCNSHDTLTAEVERLRGVRDELLAALKLSYAFMTERGVGNTGIEQAISNAKETQ